MPPWMKQPPKMHNLKDVFPLLLKEGIIRRALFQSKHKMTHMLKKRLLAYFSCLHCELKENYHVPSGII